MKKRLFSAFLLSAVLSVSLTGCGDNQSKSESSKSGTASTATQVSNGTAASNVEGSAQPAPASSPEEGKPVGAITDCDKLYDLYDGITTDMNNQLSSLQDKHNEAVGDDYTKMVNILYLPFSALRVVDVASLTAAPQDLQNAYRAIGKDDAVITQNGNEWTITYSTKDYATDQPFKFKEVIRVDLNAPYLSVVTYRDDKISGFTEMKGIGNDQYLFSTEKERAVVTYVNGKVTAFTHAENVVDTDMNGDYTANSYLFTYDEGKILDLTAVPDGWLTAADKQDKLYRLYVLQDGVIRITGLKKNYSSNSYEPGYDVTLP